MSQDRIDQLFLTLAAIVEIVEDPAPRPGLTQDPDDDYLVALAQAAGVDYLVSGDQHLTAVAMPASISPGAFVGLLMVKAGGD